MDIRRLRAAVFLISSLGAYSALPAQTTVKSGNASASPAVARVSGKPSCATCRITLTRVATLGGPKDSVLLLERSRIVADSRGRFYGTSADGYRIMAFTPDGKFQHIFGGRGNGPSEFSITHPQLAVGGGDSLFALSRRVISVFSPQFVWQRSFDLHDNSRFDVFPDNSIAVIGWRTPAPGSPTSGSDVRAFPFHIVTPGKPIKSFGPAAIKLPCSSCFLFALAVSADGEALWTSSPAEHNLMKWDKNGALLEHVMFTDSPWFTPWDPTARRPLGLFVNRVTDLSQDNTGLVWMRGAVLVDSTRSRATAIRPDAPRDDGAWTSALEAYDPIRKEIRASMRISGYPVRLIGGNLIAVMRQDSAGYVYWDVFRAELQPR